jgi:hypothetical protein
MEEFMKSILFLALVLFAGSAQAYYSDIPSQCVGLLDKAEQHALNVLRPAAQKMLIDGVKQAYANGGVNLSDSEITFSGGISGHRIEYSGPSFGYTTSPSVVITVSHNGQNTFGAEMAENPSYGGSWNDDGVFYNKFVYDTSIINKYDNLGNNLGKFCHFMFDNAASESGFEDQDIAFAYNLLNMSTGKSLFRLEEVFHIPDLDIPVP